MSLLAALQFRNAAPPPPLSMQQSKPAPAQPRTEGWHPDLKAGTLRWHGPGGVPTERLAQWHD